MFLKKGVRNFVILDKIKDSSFFKNILVVLIAVQNKKPAEQLKLN